MDDDCGGLERARAAAAKRLGLVVPVLLAVALTATALAAPRVPNPDECGVAADMAIVARALAAEDVERHKAETIMRRIYDVSHSGRELRMRLILAAAYVNREAPGEFASKLFLTCLATGGDVDRILGVGL